MPDDSSLPPSEFPDSESPLVDLRAAQVHLADLRRLRDNLGDGRRSLPSQARHLAELDALIVQAEADVARLRAQLRASGDVPGVRSRS